MAIKRGLIAKVRNKKVLSKFRHKKTPEKQAPIFMTVTRLYLKLEKNDWYQMKVNTLIVLL